MNRKFPHLCSPIQLGNVLFKNRMFSSPTSTPELTPEGFITREVAEFYEPRAKGGVASLTISEAIVHRATGMSHASHINVETDAAISGLTLAARTIRRHGAVPSIELSHGGKFAAADKIDKTAQKDVLRFGPTAEVMENGAVVQEMSRDMIRMIVDCFGQAAARCKRAGFEMVLVHAGHGWLLQQFLSPLTNRRTDEYGGSTENRARLALEVLDAVRRAVGPGFPIELRISAEEYVPGGYGLSEAIAFAKLVEKKIDLLHVSTGVHEGCFGKTHPSMFSPRGMNVHYAAEIKKHVSVPVACIGGLNEPDMMEEIIATGKADVVEMARALLADPELPNKVMAGRDDEIIRCLRCFDCMGELMTTHTRICAVNPYVMREREMNYLTRVSEPKKVLIAGGGPAGMQAAITAAQRGHKVILCERQTELGGALRCERGISFKKDTFDLVSNMANRMQKAGVEVRLNTEVTAQYAEQEAPDVLIVAAGAQPIVPPLPGIDGKNVVIANDLSEPETKVGQRVVILGGGQVGCESAVHLAREGKTVTVVEMLDELAKDANGRQRPILLEVMQELKIETKTGLRGVAVTKDGLTCADKDGREVLFPADTVVCAVGQSPRRDVVLALRDAAPIVKTIGDCVTPKRIAEAVFHGHTAGMDI